jgi:hypothetical protein
VICGLLAIAHLVDGLFGVVYGGAPCHVTKAQAEVDQIVQRLRANYNLDDSR